MVDEMSSAELRRGDPVPHFRVVAVDGRVVEYATLWQRRNLVLVALPEADSTASREYVSRFEAGVSAFGSHETACVTTHDRVPGLAPPAVLIADRWGEIAHVASAPDVGGLPSLQDVLEWVAYVQTRCPECEGETK